MTNTEHKAIRKHPGFTTVSWTQTVGFSARPRTITDLYYNGVHVSRGSRADQLALLGHAPTKAEWIAKATAA